MALKLIVEVKELDNGNMSHDITCSGLCTESESIFIKHIYSTLVSALETAPGYKPGVRYEQSFRVNKGDLNVH
jgi:hypothetical protein